MPHGTAHVKECSPGPQKSMPSLDLELEPYAEKLADTEWGHPSQRASKIHDQRLEDWKIKGKTQVGCDLGKVRTQETQWL